MDASDDAPLFLPLEEAAKKHGSQKWLVKGFIPADSTGLLFGESGSYKTFLAIDLALHVAHGLDWCGLKTMNGPVFYIAGEGGLSITKRTSAWHIQHSLNQADARFYLCPSPLFLDEYDDLERLNVGIKAIGTLNPALIIVDTLSQCMMGEEDSNTAISNLLSNLVAELRNQYPGCAMLLLHHPGHSEKKRMRGASALRANTDFVLLAEKRISQQRCVTVNPLKCKDGDLLPPQAFCLESICLGNDEDGDDITSLVAVFTGQAATKQGQKTRFGKYETRVIGVLEEKGRLLESALKEEVCKLVQQQEPTAQKDSITKGVNRAIEELVRAGRITQTDLGQLSLAEEDA